MPARGRLVVDRRFNSLERTTWQKPYPRCAPMTVGTQRLLLLSTVPGPLPKRSAPWRSLGQSGNQRHTHVGQRRTAARHAVVTGPTARAVLKFLDSRPSSSPQLGVLADQNYRARTNPGQPLQLGTLKGGMPVSGTMSRESPEAIRNRYARGHSRHSRYQFTIHGQSVPDGAQRRGRGNRRR